METLTDANAQGARPSQPGECPQTAALRAVVWLRRRGLTNLHLWLTICMVALGGVLHYTSPLAPYAGDLPFQITRHHMNRVLFMVPVVYAGFIFGPRGGFFTLIVVTVLMLPRAILLSPSPADSVLEVAAIVLVSSLIILWFNGQQKEKQRRLEVLTRLEMARQELALQVDLIKRNERRLAAINHICGAVGQSLDPRDVINLVLDKVVAEMGVDVALLFLKDPQGEHLQLMAHRGVAKEFVAAVSLLRVGEGFNGRVAQSGQALVVENASADSRLSVSQVKAEGIQSQLIVPLRSQGATIGTLCAAVRSSRRFSDDDRELLTAIGSQVGIAIEHARLYREALASEEKYRDLFANATAAIFVVDLAGSITAANNACTPLTGYAPQELLGKNLAELFPSHALAVLAKVQKDLLRGKAHGDPYEIPLIRNDGAECIVSLTTRLVYEGGQPRGLQHIALDVTERRRIRDTLNYYVRQILSAQEEERKRIARELHDETAQTMLLTLQRLDALTYRSAKYLPEAAVKELEELHGIVLQTLNNLRRLTRDLRPQILDDLGLVPAVEWLAEDMERQCGIKTSVEVAGPQRQLTPEAQLLLFRIIQEALSNVRRHSAASEARVKVDFGGRGVRIVVEDNGQGFTMPAQVRDLAGSGKLGLLGMSERARLLGGALHVESQPGKGTRISAEIEA